MRITNFKEPKSSFLSVEKDLNIITDLILKNKRLKKLLHYTTPDALDREAITDEEAVELLQKNIKIVPKLYIDGDVRAYVIISFDNFTTNATNPEFRDNIISFDIICHFDQWQLKDFQLRPYKIAAELDSMLDGQRLTGIGLVEFLGANQIIINEEFAGISLMYNVIHGGEDKKGMVNPADDVTFIEDFNESFNT